eukprot:g3389.t1
MTGIPDHLLARLGRLGFTCINIDNILYEHIECAAKYLRLLANPHTERLTCSVLLDEDALAPLAQMQGLQELHLGLHLRQGSTDRPLRHLQGLKLELNIYDIVETE